MLHQAAPDQWSDIQKVLDSIQLENLPAPESSGRDASGAGPPKGVPEVTAVVPFTPPATAALVLDPASSATSLAVWAPPARGCGVIQLVWGWPVMPSFDEILSSDEDAGGMHGPEEEASARGIHGPEAPTDGDAPNPVATPKSARQPLLQAPDLTPLNPACQAISKEAKKRALTARKARDVLMTPKKSSAKPGAEKAPKISPGQASLLFVCHPFLD